jgi:serine/threonine-protein kinase
VEGQFGAYRIEGLLGRGGMGEVYRAYDTEHRRTVALKVLSAGLAGDTAYRERFRREAHAAARLSEPHVVPIHRYGEVDGRLFLDMRLVDGTDLGDLLHRDGAMDPARAVAVVGQVARALDAAHAEGLVHRDVKPSNVLVTGSGDDEFVYLVDFGIAWSADSTEGPSLTATGSALGSFDYMAPERFLERPVDARTDVYALTCVLFECLTGRRPFVGDGLAKMMYAHLNTAPPRASSLRGGLPPALDDVLARGLAKDPDQRWPSAGALAQAARAALTSGGVAPQAEASRPPGPSQPLPRPQAVGFSDPGPAGVWGGPSRPGTPLPPAGPRQPGWQPPPPPPPRQQSRRWVPVAAAAVAAVAVAGVVAVVVTRGGDEPTPPTPTSSSAAPSTSPEQAALIALLPGGLADCAPAPSTDSGQVAALSCGPSPVQPGPQEADVRQYGDEQDADAQFLSVVDDQELEPLSSDQDCPGDLGYKYYTYEGQTSGRIGCYLTTRQDAVLFWTEEASSTVTVLTVPGGGPDGLDDLYDWWSEADNSRFTD